MCYRSWSLIKKPMCRDYAISWKKNKWVCLICSFMLAIKLSDVNFIKFLYISLLKKYSSQGYLDRCHLNHWNISCLWEKNGKSPTKFCRFFFTALENFLNDITLFIYFSLDSADNSNSVLRPSWMKYRSTFPDPATSPFSFFLMDACSKITINYLTFIRFIIASRSSTYRMNKIFLMIAYNFLFRCLINYLMLSIHFANGSRSQDQAPLWW